MTSFHDHHFAPFHQFKMVPLALFGIPPLPAPRSVILLKRGERYAFTYLPGQESAALEAVERQVRDPALSLTWSDGITIGTAIHNAMPP